MAIHSATKNEIETRQYVRNALWVELYISQQIRSTKAPLPMQNKTMKVDDFSVDWLLNYLQDDGLMNIEQAISEKLQVGFFSHQFM